ncbi:hypothetical protein [Streptomyces sp. NPDC056010]|uniref:hypothetical protein n=1 Tax=Streptomyces sp. NPDC056010 TaxID=3345679 RepID=UPI0035E397AB
MENTEIIIRLTSDEALVLSDWLERVQMTDLSRLVDDEAVWAPIHGLAGTLDKSLAQRPISPRESTLPHLLQRRPLSLD